MTLHKADPALRSPLPERHHPLARDTFAFVLAGGRGSRLHQLTDKRAKPAVPFAGKLRIIDFALSNCVNSGLRRIAVLTQYKAQSLIRHLERGWGFMAARLGEFIDVVPAQQRTGERWYSGTADAIFQNIDSLRSENSERVLILAGDHVYKMDYGVMLSEHEVSGADVTVACIEVDIDDAVHFGVIAVDAENRVVAFDEKPAKPRPMQGRPGRALASMGIYVFNTQLLIDQLGEDAVDPNSSHDFGHDLLPRMLSRRRVIAHHFENSCVNQVGPSCYWRDAGTVDAYWQANIDLCKPAPELDLFDDQWPIFSQQPQLPPAKFIGDSDEFRGMACDSLVSDGCVIDGAQLRCSVLSPRVRLGPGSKIEQSLILPNVVIGRDVRLRRVIVDKRCVLPDGFVAGYDAAEDRRHFFVSEGGVTLITQAMLVKT